MLPLLSDHKGFVSMQHIVFMICMCESSGYCKPHTPKVTDLLFLKDVLHVFEFLILEKAFIVTRCFQYMYM